MGPPHCQYGVIRKVIKPSATTDQIQSSSSALKYEVRLSQSLENVVVASSDLRRTVRVALRLHSIKGEQSQVVQVSVRLDSSVQQLL